MAIQSFRVQVIYEQQCQSSRLYEVSGGEPVTGFPGLFWQMKQTTHKVDG
ncbi:MAG: hypothetical protein ACR2PT_15035 [Endozoicomonas sp.]